MVIDRVDEIDAVAIVVHVKNSTKAAHHRQASKK